MYSTVKYMRKLYGVWMLTSVHYVSVEIFFSSFPKREKKNQKSKIKNQKSKANG